MAEFNPYKLEEEKWTPKNVYEILPPNAVSWSDYDFGQGTDNVDGEAAKKSFIDGFVDFFKELFGTAGKILGGAIELGGAVLGGFVNGVMNLVGGIANAIGSIFGGGNTESPNPPLFNPIKTNLEAAIQPHRDKIDESWQKTEEVLAEQEVLRGQMAASLEDMRDASARAKEASERAGVAITEAEAASAAATEARETLESYNTELNKRITKEFNTAVGRADTAVAKADTLAGELADFKAKHQLEIDEAIGKAEQAVADLAALSPQVADAVAKSTAATNGVSALTPKVTKATTDAKAANDKVAELTPQVENAVSQASAATANVSTLTPIVNDAASKAAKASTDVSALSPRVDDAVAKANKATSDLSTLTPKVTAAQSRADAAYTEAGKVRSEVAPQIEAAQTKGENALAVADKAVDWLKNPTEIGTSVIAVDPETKRPYYANHLDLVDDNPPGTSGPTYMSPASMDSKVSLGPHVPVDSKIKYTVSFWAKASVAGSVIYGQLQSQNGTNYAPDGTGMFVGEVSVTNPPQPSNRGEDGEYVHRKGVSSYFIAQLELPTEWTYYETEIQFTEGVTAVRISAMFWDHSKGVPADQYISGLDIRPQIPTQASVDQAQNDAIRANSEILRQQDEINDAQAVANLAQKNFNDNQTKWNLASTNATKALADAQQVQSNLNIEQGKLNTLQSNFNTKQTEWNAGTTAALEAQKKVNDNFTKWNTAATQAKAAQDKLNEKQDEWNSGVTAALDAQKKVDDNFKKWSDGAATAIEANTKAIALLNSPNGGSSLIPINPLTAEPYYLGWAGDRISVANIDTVPTRTAVKYTTSAKKRLYPPSDQLKAVKVSRGQVYRWTAWVYSNIANTGLLFYLRDPATGTGAKNTKHDEASGTRGHSSYGLLINGISSGWNRVSGTIEFKDEISAVEMYSIEWNQSNISSSVTQYVTGLDIAPDVPTQASVDKAQNDAISANTEALKALGKKVLGASLVPYKTPSTQEVKDYAAGKLSYDPWADPEHVAAGHYVWSTSRGRVPAASSSQTTKSYSGSLVSVDSTIEYKVKFSTWADDAGSKIYVYMLDQDGNTAVAETPFCDATKASSHLVSDMTLPKGWKDWSGVIKFKPGVTQVKLATFYWNHSRGTITTRQALAGLEIVPNIPDANVVNELQDNAIRKNTEVGSSNKAAIDALRDGLDASIELSTVNELIGQLETRIHEEEKARGRLQTKIDNLQNEMIPRTIVWESSRETLDDYISMPASNKVVALPGWTGQMVVTSVIRRGRGTSSEPTYYQTSINRYSVPDGTSREWTIYSGASYEAISSMRVDYWIYRGKTRAINMANGGGYITGSSYVQSSERTIASYKVGKTYGTGQIEWRAQLKNANRETTYRFIVRVTGQPDKTFTWKGVGPLTGLGSGLVTLKFDHEFNLPDNATVSIVAYTNASYSSRAIVNYSMGILTYVENTQ